jgi:hypothetical protein
MADGKAAKRAKAKTEARDRKLKLQQHAQDKQRRKQEQLESALQRKPPMDEIEEQKLTIQEQRLEKSKRDAARLKDALSDKHKARFDIYNSLDKENAGGMSLNQLTPPALAEKSKSPNITPSTVVAVRRKSSAVEKFRSGIRRLSTALGVGTTSKPEMLVRLAL